MLLPLITTCTLTLFYADPPALPYLSTEPIDQLFVPNSAPFKIILASDYTNENQDEVWKVWGHPTVVEYFGKRPELSVIYLDEESHQDRYLEACKPQHLPTIMLWPHSNSSRVQRRPETLETPEELINWLNHVQVNRYPHDNLYRQVAIHPDRIAIRLDLIDELNDADQNLGADFLYPWLLLNNQLWLDAINESVPVDTPPLTEAEFRSVVIEQIERLRTTYNLFVSERQSERSAQSRQVDMENWVDQYHWRSRQFGSGPVLSLKWFLNALIPVIEQLQDNESDSTATDRDIFILSAFLAEPPVWNELLEEYGINNKP